MKFSDEVWTESTEILSAICMHPFNRELAEGTLAKEKFQFYLKQDSLYLVDFARALAITGGKSVNAEEIEKFLKFSQGALIAERQLHQHYFDLYEIKLDIEQSPSCFAYTQFLLSSAAIGEFSEAVAALLPCFWVYREVGHLLSKKTVQNNPYSRWIENYSSEDFDRVVASAICITDRVAESATEKQKNAMKNVFALSCRLEWLFWDSAYRLETWNP